MLARDGWNINMKRTYRIYRDLGLKLRNKTPKCRVKAKLRDDRQEAICPNDIWAMNFVHDQLATGKKIDPSGPSIRSPATCPCSIPGSATGLRTVTFDLSRPGKPTDNAYIQAFNGRFRAECLNDLPAVQRMGQEQRNPGLSLKSEEIRVSGQKIKASQM